MKTLLLRTSLWKQNVHRDIEIPENATLYRLARFIVKAYDFDFDHCFGFYSDIVDNFYHDSKRKYELFADLDDCEPTDAKSVKNTKISYVWKKIGDKMMFLFDYGDGWRFVGELNRLRQKSQTKTYPIIFNQKGTAPLQYSPLENEYDKEVDEDEIINFDINSFSNMDDLKVIKEYFDWHQKIPYENNAIPTSEIKKSLKILKKNNANNDELKLAIIILGHVGSEETMRALVDYAKQASEDLAFWLKTAIGESMIFLDENKEY